MNTVQTLQIESTSSDATELIGEHVGRQLKGGEVIELISDLGGGKTTFVRGLARGFGSCDRVASPTFTISKVYTAGAREIQHYDFYRLQNAGMTAHELHEGIGDPNVVAVIEWGDVVAHVLPDERITLMLTRTGDDTRQLRFTFPGSLAYVLEGIT